MTVQANLGSVVAVTERRVVDEPANDVAINSLLRRGCRDNGATRSR